MMVSPHLRHSYRPFPNEKRDAAQTIATGHWDNGRFVFSSPEAEEGWYRSAYKQAVNADTWHLGDKIEDQTRDVILTEIGGPTKPIYRGPDGQYYFHNARTVESAETRAHRSIHFAGKTMDQIAAKRMPGEEEYIEKRRASTPIIESANDNAHNNSSHIDGRGLNIDPLLLSDIENEAARKVERSRKRLGLGHMADDIAGHLDDISRSTRSRFKGEKSSASIAASTRLESKPLTPGRVDEKTTSDTPSSFIQKEESYSIAEPSLKEANSRDKQLCIALCTRLALPTDDFGISFFRCMNQCMGTNTYPEWVDKI